MAPSRSDKRKHVTTACIACRESKCDGTTPVCQTCINKGKECRYEAREDRRKFSLKGAVDILLNRVNGLSSYIVENGLDVPPMTPEDERALSSILRNLGMPWPGQPQTFNAAHNDMATGTGTTGAAATESTSNVTADFPDFNQPPFSSASDGDGGGTRSHDVLAGHTGYSPLAGASGHAAAAPLGPAMEPMGDFAAMQPTDVFYDAEQAPSSHPMASSSSPSADGLVDDLSDRVGTLQIRPGGHIRFFGSTSNFNLLDVPSSDLDNINRTVRNDGLFHLARFGLDKHVPAAIEEHLVNLYFTWQDPSCHIVDRNMYDDARARWHGPEQDTAYYSEALRNAICSLGAAFDSRHHPEFVTFPRSLAEFFADRCKALLEIELNQPCVATVQAMLILSSHEMAHGRDTRGWLFSGMAIRLAFVLALHQDLSTYVQKGLVSEAEVELRRTVFWAACVGDCIWSFYLGQPMRVTYKDVTITRPEPKASTPEQWMPYVSPGTPQSSIADFTLDVARYQITLFDIMIPLSATLYGDLSSTKLALQELSAQCVAEMVNWRNTLPPDLQVDQQNYPNRTYLPHVLMLHMQYHQCIIHAHRPWISKRRLQPQPPHGPGPAHAQHMCMESAIAVSKLLRLYEDRFTLRRMNIYGVSITFSAALILVFALVMPIETGSEEETLSHLSVCFRALDELSLAWENAKRTRDFLVKLQRHWEVQSRSAVRRESLSQSDSSGTRKRRRDFAGAGEEDMSARMPQNPAILDADNDAIVDFDIDWMLGTDIPDMPKRWGNFFSVPSGEFISGPGFMN